MSSSFQRSEIENVDMEFQSPQPMRIIMTGWLNIPTSPGHYNSSFSMGFHRIDFELYIHSGMEALRADYIRALERP